MATPVDTRDRLMTLKPKQFWPARGQATGSRDPGRSVNGSFRVRAIGCVAIVLLAGCRSAPAYVGLPAPELFEYAEAAYDRRDWDEAIASLERLVAGAPGFNQMAEVRLKLGQAYLEKGDHITASSEFLRFSSTYPTHELMPDAALGVCRAQSSLSPIPDRDQRYTIQAISSCETLRLDYPGTPQAATADSLWTDMREKLARKDLGRGEFYFNRGLLDSGLVFFEDVVGDFPETTAAPVALLFIVRTYERLGYEEDAVEARQRLLDQYPESEAAREFTDAF